MMRPEVLKMLVCPETRSPLSIAPSELVSQINQAISVGDLTNRAGQKLDRQLDGGLLRADGAVLYPIVDDIPMMLIDEAIPLDQSALNN